MSDTASRVERRPAGIDAAGTWRPAAAKLERVQLALLGALAASCFTSIFAAQAALALATAVYLLRLALGQVRFGRLPIDGPVLAFSVWTLLSASFSPEPQTSFGAAKKLVLFATLYLASSCLVERKARERVLDAALLGALALAARLTLQYHLLGFDSLENRPSGFLGHYMTAAGLCMLGLLLAMARLGLGPRAARPVLGDLWAVGSLGAALGLLCLAQASEVFAVEAERLVVAALAAAAAFLTVSRGPWPGAATGYVLAALTAPLSVWALLASQTRNAWVGALAGLTVVAVLKAPRLLWLLVAGVATLAVLRPAPVVERLTIKDASSLDRYYMWQAGADMIRDKPVFGQGPGMILEAYPSYRWPEAPNPMAPHLHDNVLQVAAERGIPGLAWWLWWVVAIMVAAYGAARHAPSEDRWVGVSALAMLTAVMVAGVFEYNLGDSEILMLVLLVSALPYAIRRERIEAGAAT